MDDEAAQMIASGGNRLFAIHGKNGLYRASGNRFCERCRLKNASIIWQTNQKILLMFVKQIFEDFENLENKKESNLNKTCCCRPAVNGYNESGRIYLYNSIARA